MASASRVAILIAIAFGAAPAFAQQTGQLTTVKLAAWLDAYGEAWESRDADKAAELFAAASSYQVTPYDEPHVGPEGVRRYWAGVTDNQRNVQFEYRILGSSGNTGIAHWWAEFDVEPGGAHLALDGIFVLDFDANGKCTRLREWWHLKSEEAAVE